jgi:hypothetical protein
MIFQYVHIISLYPHHIATTGKTTHRIPIYRCSDDIPIPLFTTMDPLFLMVKSRFFMVKLACLMVKSVLNPEIPKFDQIRG